MAWICSRGCLGWILGKKKSLLEECSDMRTGCQGGGGICTHGDVQRCTDTILQVVVNDHGGIRLTVGVILELFSNQNCSTIK